MPLDILRHVAFAAQLSQFVSEPPSVFGKRMTGLHLKFDDYALAWAKYEAARLAGLPHWVASPAMSPPGRYLREIMRKLLGNIATGGQAGHAIPDWNRRCREMDYDEGSNPIIVMVDVEPDTPGSAFREFPRSTQGFPIRCRRSAAAEPLLGAGDGIRAGTSSGGGTLGGFLKDSTNGDLYGVTCEHVVGSVGTVVDLATRPTTRIGTVSHAQRSTAGPPCNKHANPNAGTVDVALIRIDNGVNVTLVPTVTTAGLATIDQDDPVKFQGSISRSVNTIRVAAATIWKAINFGLPVCFADLFALDHRVATYVVSSVSQSGDSGSWIMEDPSNPPLVPSWYGMLIAGDRQQSYACYAEHLLTWAQSQHSLQLP